MTTAITIFLFILFTWIALILGNIIPILGSSIIAILIGILLRYSPIYRQLSSEVINVIEKYFLKAGIVLLGFTLSLRILGDVGLMILALLFIGVIVSIALSYIGGKTLKLPSNLAFLIGIGTSICGGSAIVATAPLLEAKNDEVAVSITTMLIYSMSAIILLPMIGEAMGYHDQLFGILAGAAVNDTASVVATATEWSDNALKIATLVKLVRTLFLIPVTLAIIGLNIHNQTLANHNNQVITMKQIINMIPVFVILFMIAVTIASAFQLPVRITNLIENTSKILMTMALMTIGIGIDFTQIKKAGIRPVILGGICWLGVLTSAMIMLGIFY